MQKTHSMPASPTQRQTEDRDHLHNEQNPEKPSFLNLQAIASHTVLPAVPEEQAYYVLLNIALAADLPTAQLPLNLCLVLDHSTSMQGMRLRHTKEAARRIIDRLQPQDAFSLVVFSDRAEVLLPSQRDTDKAAAKSVASTIQPNGGTEILQGLLAGVSQIKHGWSENSVNHIVLLTDGHTYGDERACLDQAEWAGQHHTNISSMGIGEDWNEDLLDGIAALSGGSSTYIDTPRNVVEAFEETLRHLRAIVARDLTMTVTPSPFAEMRQVFQVVPYIRRLALQRDEATRARLGPLGTDQGKKLLLEFLIQKPEPGKQKLARITVDSDAPEQAEYRPWETIDLDLEFKEDARASSQIPSEVVTVLGRFALHTMQEKVLADLDAGEIDRAARRLETLATRLLNLGDIDLARSASLEAGRLARSGSLSDEGRKKIRYGTRCLSPATQETDRD